MNIFKKKISLREMAQVINGCFDHCVKTLMKNPLYYSNVIDVSNEKLCDQFLTEMYAFFFFEVRIYINNNYGRYKHTIWNYFSQDNKRGELFDRYSFYAKSWNGAIKQRIDGKKPNEAELVNEISKTFVKNILKRDDIRAVEMVEKFYYAFKKMLHKSTRKYKLAV